MTTHDHGDHDHTHDDAHGHDRDHDAHGHDEATMSFDARAATWDENPSHVERATVVAAAIAELVPLSPATRLFEYGAGTGLVSQALRPHVGAIVLADTSQGMRDVIQSKIDSGALDGAAVADVDLAAGVPTGAPFDEPFDVAVTVMTLHHIGALAAVLDSFAAILVPGGRLCISDLDAEDGSFHGDGFSGHHGFVRSELGTALETAGFSDITFRDCHQVERESGTYPMFLAVCTRP